MGSMKGHRGKKIEVLFQSNNVITLANFHVLVAV